MRCGSSSRPFDLTRSSGEGNGCRRSNLPGSAESRLRCIARFRRIPRGNSAGERGIRCHFFLDVLEHLFFPEEVLRETARLLKPGGVIIFCVPNALCLPARLLFLRGQWPLRESGLFDGGHIRFFTWRNLEEHLGPHFEIDRVSFQTVPLEPCYWAGLGRLAKIQKRFLRALSNLWPSLWALEFIFQIRPTCSGEPSPENGPHRETEHCAGRNARN